MLKLGIMLIGFAALRQQWPTLMFAGLVSVALACWMIITPVSGIDRVIILLFSIPILAHSAASGILLIKLKGGEARAVDLWFSFLEMLIGIGIIGSVFSDSRAVSILLAAALYLDGVIRLVPAILSRYPAWHLNVVRSSVELLLATMLAANWPLSEDRATTTTLALLICMSGWGMLRFAYLLRTHEHEAALLLLPVFGKRGWYDHAPVLADYNSEPEVPAGPMTLYVWMPVLLSGSALSVPVVNRYLVAKDSNGTLSVGHVALELPSGLYVSHYRDLEASRLPNSLLEAVGPQPENQAPGLFRSSYVEEQNLWGQAHLRIHFHTFNLRRLHAFWVGYKQDSTYNLVNRNCSTLIAAALDSSLEGVLSCPRPWMRLLMLLFTPDFWQAAFIRNRAESTTWTPGLIRDYAEPLARILHRYRSV